MQREKREEIRIFISISSLFSAEISGFNVRVRVSQRHVRHDRAGVQRGRAPRADDHEPHHSGVYVHDHADVHVRADGRDHARVHVLCRLYVRVRAHVDAYAVCHARENVRVFRPLIFLLGFGALILG